MNSAGDASAHPDARRRRVRKGLFFAVCSVACLIALGLAWTRAFFESGRGMVVVTVDEQGKQIGLPQFVINPKPEVVDRNGLSHLDAYVARLMASRARFTSVIVMTADGQRGLSVHFTEGRASLSLDVDWRRQPQQEQAIRRLFSGLNITPTQDYLAGNGDVPDATRVLEYPLTGGPAQVAGVCKRVLREVYGVTDRDGLDFTYQESK
jgi:hypothetical protein